MSLGGVGVKYDLVAFGVHPDDLEIGIFGTLAKEIKLGKKVLLVDLTAGEMGSNGTPTIRAKEASDAAKLIGADRICLNLPDRGIRCNNHQIAKVVEVIRQTQSSWIFYPYHSDYHPDHERGSQLIREAILSSGLIHYKTEDLEPHRPAKTAMYYINDVKDYNLLVDISDFIHIKKEALQKHVSQFERNENSRETYLNNDFIDKVINRDAYFGTLCNKAHVEPIKLVRPPVIESLDGVLL